MQILVTPTQKYEAYSKLSKKQSIESYINENSLYIERDKAEEDPSFLQYIPYVVVENEEGIFAYTRLKQGSEARLHGKMSIGIGGHVDKLDTSDSHVPHSILVWQAAYRELFEELDVELTDKFLDIRALDKCIYDPSNSVGMVHLGLLMHCSTNGRKVSVQEKDKIQGRFFSKGELQDIYYSDPQNFETWSRIVLQELAIV